MTQPDPDVWDKSDSANAARDGWDLFEVEGNWQIQRDDDASIFANDAEAWAHIVEKAKANSALHLKALRCVPPSEIAVIERALGTDIFLID